MLMRIFGTKHHSCSEFCCQINEDTLTFLPKEIVICFFGGIVWKNLKLYYLAVDSSQSKFGLKNQRNSDGRVKLDR